MDHEAQVQGEIGIAVERGIEESAERSHATDAARHLTIRHIQKAGKEENRRALAKMAHCEAGRRPRIHGQAEKREHVGSKSRGGETAYHMAQEPTGAFSYPIGYRPFSIRMRIPHRFR